MRYALSHGPKDGRYDNPSNYRYKDFRGNRKRWRTIPKTLKGLGSRQTRELIMA